MFYWLYKDVNGHWRWTLFAANARKIANSGEGYKDRADALAAIALVKQSAPAPVREPAAA
jgi:uncharacterized protein YegP (UPF0339 family)